MSEQIPESYPRCRFCGEPMGDGSLILEEKLYSRGLLTVCGDCYRLIGAVVEDSFPQLLRKIMDKAENPLRERLGSFNYRNWEKYVKKKP